MNITLENKPLPVLLLTGYLGSGKTTLLNRILTNRRGIKFAVIVNDLGEVNIDADLIEKGGVVGQTDDSLVALQNGCICCTLKMDLVAQLEEIARMKRFDYIAIEASGICEPAPIAQTINSYPQLARPAYPGTPVPTLDCIVTVVDALRMKDEFACGEALQREDIDEEDIENLVIEQIEFCNIVLLNKASEVTPEELGRVKSIVRALQPKAEIIPCDYGEVELDKLLNTGLFDFDKVATSAAWIAEIEGDDEDDHEDDHDHDDHDDHDEHGHHHHHHHDEDEGEAEEYGIGTYVYESRPALDLNKFDYMVARKWPKEIIRAKGLCYFSADTDKCYLFETAGKQKTLKDAGYWFATMPADQLREMMARDAKLRRDWDPEYGDRMNKIVFIGQHLDGELIESLMDSCLDV
ncbi:MAG: GTP-binding protein [Bacteroidales bacterium]|nr:GTP-binding protein [Bacteroidales bacterium]